MRRGVLAIAVLLAVMAPGCGGTETTGSSTGASIVPAGVPAFVALDTNPESSQWKTIDALASKFPDKQKAVDSFKKDLREQGLDWDRDVKPALGPETDVVWLDFANNGENVVLLMQPDDKDAFRRAIEKGNKSDSSGDKAVYEEFRGWTVLSDKQALIDRFKALSDKSSESLEEDAAFKKAMASVPDESLVRAYVDGRKVMDEAFARAVPGDEKLIRQIGTLDWLTASVAGEQDGLAMDTTVHGSLGELFGKSAGAPSFDAKLPGQIPKDAVFYWTFHGTQDLFTSLEENPSLSGPELKPFLGVLGEIGALLQGENALYVRPAAGGELPEVTFVAEPKAGKSGRATLDEIIGRFATDLGVKPVHGTVAGVPASTLDLGFFKIHYADVGGKLVVTDLPAGIQGVKDPGTPLAEGETFKDAVASSGMPQKTHGFLYVDIEAGTGLAEKLSGAKLPPDVSRNLKPLRSVVEYAVSRSHQLSVRLFLRVR